MPVRAPAAQFSLVLVSCLLAACASTPDTDDSTSARVAYDPWEPLNRGVYAFNDTADKAVLKPVAKGYKAITPTFARRGVSNFFDNLVTPRSALNNLLQGQPKQCFNELARFLINSTLGLGGLIDVAGDSGMQRYDETFAQTLAVWGLPAGPYVMVPLRGPRTLLDVVAMPVDLLTDPLIYYENTSIRDKLLILSVIDTRTRLLSADRFLDDSSDPYITLRESYLQNREYEIYDGDPPVDDDFYDEFLDEDL